MVRRHIAASVMALALTAWPAGAQTGPPPEVRALLDAFIAALNSGSADAWDAMATARFSPGLLAKRPAAERKQQYETLHDEFGTVTLERVNRRGPDAPLELMLRGSTGVSGTIALTLDEGNPPRIAGLAVNIGAGADEPGDVAPPPINGRMAAEELSRSLDGYLSKLTSDEVFSGVALVARDGKPIFHKAYGYADRGNRIPNTTSTRFNIGSINKTFTQMAIRQLVAQGKLAVTDTLGRFFPDYPQAVSRGATVQQLLSHAAGLADFFGEAFTRAPKDQFRSNADYFRFVSMQPPLFAPGARRQYCNGCYIALGAIIERVADMPYEQFVAEQIFKRADMSRTGYPHVDAIESEIAIGYTRRSQGGLRNNVYLHGAAGSAAGGGYSTAGDLLAFVNASRLGRLPGGEPGLGIAGGAPGTSAVVESNSEWTVIVLTNLDPPTGERLGVAVMRALGR